MAKQYYQALGRRKEATATVRVFSGKGEVTVAEKTGLQHFGHKSLLDKVLEPLKVLELHEKYDVSLLIKGGGLNSHAEAARLGVARALVEMNPDYKPTLKKAGFLTRDDRVKERKKYGLKRARKAPQFTKR
ncbi:MAG: 30S ribosomal protein S9 [Candidatus Saccharimonadales bacterium]